MNYYQAVEKKSEHGGGWVFMQLNRRSGAAVVCRCGSGPKRGFAAPGHPTAAEADLCFWQAQLAKRLIRSRRLLAEGDRSPKCERCRRFTDREVSVAGHLLFDSVALCERCAPLDDDAATRAALALARPFRAGIQITASW